MAGRKHNVLLGGKLSKVAPSEDIDIEEEETQEQEEVEDVNKKERRSKDELKKVDKIPPTIFPSIDDQLVNRGVIFLEDECYCQKDNIGCGPFEAKQKVMVAGMNPYIDQIVIMINSQGGDVEPFIALHDTILMVRRVFKKEVVTIVSGIAASAAALILQAGEHRWATKLSTIMLHRITYSIEGTDVEHEKETKILKEKFQKRIFRIWARKMGITVKELADKMKEDGPDLWYTATEAKKSGLIDRII